MGIRPLPCIKKLAKIIRKYARFYHRKLILFIFCPLERSVKIVSTAWRILRLRMEKMASMYGG
jgi:hypothetical protein